MISTISGYLRGEGKLWKAYWLFYQLPIFVISLIVVRLFILKIIDPIEPFLYGFMIMMAIIVTTSSIAVWQCSRNCKRSIWTWIVRLLILYWLASELYFGIKSSTFFWQFGTFNLVSVSVLFHVSFFVFLFIYIFQGDQYKATTTTKLRTTILILMALSIFSSFITAPYGYETLSDGRHLLYFGSRGHRFFDQTNINTNEPSQRIDSNDALQVAYDYSDAKNYKEAAKWYQIAINYGNVHAKNNLAILYNEGRGVPKDMKKAMQLYHDAAQEGDFMAYYNIGQVFEFGEYGEQSYTKAFEHYLIAAQHGNGCALNDLGMFYAAGTGVPADTTQATKWLEKAADFGLNNANVLTEPLTKKQISKAFVQYQLAKAKHETVPLSLNNNNGLRVAEELANYFQHHCRD